MQETANITLSLGKPVTAPILIPVTHSSTPACINDPFMIEGKCYKVTAISLGTPHGAVFVDNVEEVKVTELGAALGTHGLFPKGANIVFIQVADSENIKVRLWQRGEGEKAFTPEAACVAGTVSMMLQKTYESAVNVSINGNTVLVKWNRGNGDVFITGPRDLMQDY